MHLYGFSIVNVGYTDKTSGCNSQMGYKTKLLKRGEAGQQCTKHTPIGFRGKYTIKFYAYCVKQENMNNYNYNNNNNMENWAVSAMCQKPRLLFPINLILLG